jgi:hypothetical protein
LPLRRALNVVWHFLSKDGTRQNIEKLKIDLMRPLPGMAEEVSDEVVSNELAMFTAALAKKKA